MKKKFSIAILFVVMTLVIIPAAPAQSASINGWWENNEGGDLWVISFIEDTFITYRNGEILQYGPYTLEPSTWGVTVTSNKPRNLFMEFGFERSYQGLSYDISANELVLSDEGWRPIAQNGYARHFKLGRYRRGREPSEAGNPLIGAWRRDYDYEGVARTAVYRFLPNGKGVVIDIPQKYSLIKASLLRVTYELGAKPGTGQISLWRVDMSTPNWDDVVFLVSPFVIDGNILRMDELGEYRKR
jgi:hypothetical protein